MKSFAFLERDFAVVTALIKDEDLRCKTVTAIVEYGLYGRSPTFDNQTASTAFAEVKKNIDRTKEKSANYSRAARKREENKSNTKLPVTNETTTNFGGNKNALDKSQLRAQRAMRAIMSAPVKRNGNDDQ